MSASTSRHAKLEEYNRKRDFTVTAEPPGKRGSEASASGPVFVVQKHAASHLHYDFRLEHGGVLLSWAVPKGPSLRVGERRLAMRTEDHPLAYATFEGTIPEGEYGGGKVLVWDYGTWETEQPDEQVRAGRLTFTLHGHKLRGRFHLVRSKGERGRERWLLFKGDDAGAQDEEITETRPESVLSGAGIEDVGERVWHADPSARSERVAKPPSRKRTSARKRTTGEATAADPVLQAVASLKLGFPLTSLDKVLYPKQGLRKADLIAYYAAVAPRMLPHVANRPLVLVRCPEGSGRKCFYQKHFEQGLPKAIFGVAIEESAKRGEYGYVKDRLGLAALAQLGVLEVHTWGCHVDRVEQPDLFVFDLDPDEGLAWQRVVDAAQALRVRLRELKLESFVKTTGGKGLHVVVPVVRKWSWEEHKAMAYALVSELEQSAPDLYVTNMSKQARKGKLFLDYLRNGRGATAIAPYSTRAREGALVATPISWQELEAGAQPRDFDLGSVVQRLDAERNDPWAHFFKRRQGLTMNQVRQLTKSASARRR